MSTRSPIATPPSVHWREFRHRVMPYIIFALVALGTVLLWNQRIARSSMVGQAEAVRTLVVATHPGTIASLKFDLFQAVRKGEIVAQLVPANLGAVTAELKANVDELRARLTQDSDRFVINYQGLRLDWLRRNVELASARLELQLAESEYQRYAALHASKTVSDVDFELRRSNRDVLKDKVGGLERLSIELEVEIARLKPNARETPVDRAIAAATLAQRKQLQALSDAAILRAPMDGAIAALQKRPGETAVPGDVILTIGARQATRIVAYVRQPLNVQPKVGDMVDVSARTGTRRTAPARVLQVGTQLELIEPALLPASMSSSRVAEYGLPLLVEIPATLKLAPGEIVNLVPRRQ